MRPLHSFSVFALALASQSACDRAPSFGVTLQVVDEAGAPLPDATVTWNGRTRGASRQGRLHLGSLDHPALAVVAAPGYLPEPVPLGRWDAAEPVTVKLYAEAGGRIVTHFAGDVMLGRRYDEVDTGAPILADEDDGASAEALVSDAALAFNTANLISVNLETVVGDLDEADAYPGKRWLLLTRPQHLSALDTLGVNLVGLANNHQRDWMDEGVAATLENLDARGMPYVGAGLTPLEASQPLVGDVGDLKVGLVAWTSVDGDYVNDQYPRDEDEAPAELSAEDAFKWEARQWGEPALDEEQAAALWASAEAVYPELQDWVARRGHGGAARWDAEASPAAIAALRAQVDLLVVQLHMGFQFADAPGDGVQEAAHAAIDAGADLVVCHHPHVLQGLEWYKGHLIAWSLGNYIFDQNFLSTFPSGFLRLIWNGDGTLAEARFVPGFLDAWQPQPVADGLAAAVLRSLWDRSGLGVAAQRGEDLVVRTVAGEVPPDAAPPGFRFERGGVVIEAGLPEPTPAALLLGADTPGALPRGGLVRLGLSDPPPVGVEVGRDLFKLGQFENDDMDEDPDEAIGWTWSSADVSLSRRRPGAGVASLQMVRQPGDQDRLFARAMARVSLAPHRLYADADGAAPLDGEARYSVHLRAWRDGEPDLALVRIVLYNFDDLDPTEAPGSTILREVSLPFDPGQPGWRELWLDLPDDAMDPVNGVAPNAALIYLNLDPPSTHTTILRVDDVQLVEWRAADEQPAGWGALDWARARDGAAHTLSVDTLPW